MNWVKLDDCGVLPEDQVVGTQQTLHENYHQVQ